jgi:hypothetical protein
MGNKIFSSSFIQPWFTESWDYTRWTDELIMLKDVGINEIIIQNTADTHNRYAIYPSKIGGYSCFKTDVVYTALSAALCVGIKVRIGLELMTCGGEEALL